MTEIERNYFQFANPYSEILISQNKEEIEEILAISTSGFYKNLFVKIENSNVEDSIKKIFSMKELQYNWDSYNAEKISIDCISLSIELIRLLESHNIIIDNVFPMRDGGIQLEKDVNDLSIEIEISPERKINFLVFDKNNNLKIEVDYDIFKLDDLIENVKEHYGEL